MLRNRLIDLKVVEIKHEDLISNLEMNWKQFFQNIINEEMNNVFNNSQSINQKVKMFMKFKSVVIDKRIYLFNFIINEEYDVKKSIL
jgi:hypothetical protein